MTSTQVSFSAFALVQQAVSCTPPAAIPDAAPVVAHGLGVGSGGECTGPVVTSSYLVAVVFPSGARAQYRFLTAVLAKKFARGFSVATVERVRGYMTFEGWVRVDLGAAA